ncbi:MAG: hypothetical protein R2838_10295 [Caldilineaceae bacterium]
MCHQRTPPKFKREELDRCIRIPVDEKPGPELDEILHLMRGPFPHVYLNTGHVSLRRSHTPGADLAQEYGIAKVLVASSVTKIASMAELLPCDQGAFIEDTLAAYTTTPIPKTHCYVERSTSPSTRRHVRRAGRRHPRHRADRHARPRLLHHRHSLGVTLPSRWRAA